MVHESDVRCIDYCKKGVLVVHESDVRCIDYCKKGVLIQYMNEMSDVLITVRKEVLITVHDI